MLEAADDIGPTPADENCAPHAELASTTQKAAWGSGSVPDQLMANGIGSLAMPIYNINLGVSPEMLGYALAIPRVFDALIDPCIGNLSDNTRSRWGRRRPWIAAGGLLCALFFTLLWIPPATLGVRGLFWYFLIISFFYYLGYAIYSIPRTALGYELSTDYHDRTRVMAWNSFFAYVAGLFIPWLYRLSFIGADGGAPAEAHGEMAGVRYVAIFTSLLILLFTLPTLLFCRERSEAQAQPKIQLLSAFKMTMTNRPFLLMAMMSFFLSLGIAVVSPMNLYINIYYVCGGDKKFGSELFGIVGTMSSIMGGLSILVIPWFATRVGKKPVIATGMVLAILGFLSSWLLFTPAHPYWQIIPSMLLVPGLTCGYILCGSILADICDLDELESGRRREGMFGAAFAFQSKALGAGQMILAGYVLVWAGYRQAAVLSPDVLYRLRIMFAAVPTICILLAIIMVYLLPVTEKRVREARTLLDARRRAAQAEAATL
jgi:GPH family glycoside/pentoside/hexuronide:cation symporter